VRTGDLLAVGVGDSELSAAIAESGQAGSDYDHIGLVERCTDGVFIWNANATHGVCRSPLTAFINREAEAGSKAFHVYRLAHPIAWDEVFAKLRRWAGLPYNQSFHPSDDSFYCADLIARAFPDGFFAPHPMQFNGDFWETYYAKIGSAIPHNEPGFHPADMLKRDDIRFVGELPLAASSDEDTVVT